MLSVYILIISIICASLEIQVITHRNSFAPIIAIIFEVIFGSGSLMFLLISVSFFFGEWGKSVSKNSDARLYGFGGVREVTQSKVKGEQSYGWVTSASGVIHWGRSRNLDGHGHYDTACSRFLEWPRRGADTTGRYCVRCKKAVDYGKF
jgi:hypothetical protein